MTAVPSPTRLSQPTAPEQAAAEETTPLIRPSRQDEADDEGRQEERRRTRDQLAAEDARPENVSRAAGLIGLSTGLGALLAVLVLLRLPPLFASWLARHRNGHTGDDGQEGEARLDARALQVTFHLVALLAALQGTFIFFAFRPRPRRPRPRRRRRSSASNTAANGSSSPIRSRRSSDSRLIKARRPCRASLRARVCAHTRRFARHTFTGFALAARDLEAFVAHLSAFLARAQAIVVSAFIPLLVRKVRPPPLASRSANRTNAELDGVITHSSSTSMACALMPPPPPPRTSNKTKAVAARTSTAQP